MNLDVTCIIIKYIVYCEPEAHDTITKHQGGRMCKETGESLVII